MNIAITLLAVFAIGMAFKTERSYASLFFCSLAILLAAAAPARALPEAASLQYDDATINITFGLVASGNVHGYGDDGRCVRDRYSWRCPVLVKVSGSGYREFQVRVGRTYWRSLDSFYFPSNPWRGPGPLHFNDEESHR